MKKRKEKKKKKKEKEAQRERINLMVLLNQTLYYGDIHTLCMNESTRKTVGKQSMSDSKK